jgi:type I restriction enzyme M protein
LIKEIVLMAFCELATIDEIKSHSYALTPGWYVDAAEIEDDGIPFFLATIKKNLEVLGYGE